MHRVNQITTVHIAKAFVFIVQRPNAQRAILATSEKRRRRQGGVGSRQHCDISDTTRVMQTRAELADGFDVGGVVDEERTIRVQTGYQRDATESDWG